jgi:hypothetical protein
MVGILLLVSLAFNVLMLIHIEDKEEEQQLTDWDNNNLKEWLWNEQQKVKMLEEECNILRDDLHLEQQLREDAGGKKKQITLTVDAKAVTEKVLKEINKKMAEMKENKFL